MFCSLTLYFLSLEQKEKHFFSRMKTPALHSKGQKKCNLPQKRAIRAEDETGKSLNHMWEMFHILGGEGGIKTHNHPRLDCQ